jgi:hypothetical protein
MSPVHACVLLIGNKNVRHGATRSRRGAAQYGNCSGCSTGHGVQGRGSPPHGRPRGAASVVAWDPGRCSCHYSMIQLCNSCKRCCCRWPAAAGAALNLNQDCRACNALLHHTVYKKRGGVRRSSGSVGIGNVAGQRRHSCTSSTLAPATCMQHLASRGIAPAWIPHALLYHRAPGSALPASHPGSCTLSKGLPGPRAPTQRARESIPKKRAVCQSCAAVRPAVFSSFTNAQHPQSRARFVFRSHPMRWNW